MPQAEAKAKVLNYLEIIEANNNEILENESLLERFHYHDHYHLCS
jgi:hypothetical protein